MTMARAHLVNPAVTRWFHCRLLFRCPASLPRCQWSVVGRAVERPLVNAARRTTNFVRCPASLPRCQWSVVGRTFERPLVHDARRPTNFVRWPPSLHRRQWCVVGRALERPLVNDARRTTDFVGCPASLPRCQWSVVGRAFERPPVDDARRVTGNGRLGVAHSRRLFREGKAAISREVAEIFERLGSECRNLAGAAGKAEAGPAVGAVLSFGESSSG